MAAKKKPAYQDPSKKNRATTKDKPKGSGPSAAQIAALKGPTSTKKPTEAITAKGQKATGLAKSTVKGNRFSSTAKTPVYKAQQGLRGTGTPLASSLGYKPTKENIVNAALTAVGGASISKKIISTVGKNVLTKSNKGNLSGSGSYGTTNKSAAKEYAGRNGSVTRTTKGKDAMPSNTYGTPNKKLAESYKSKKKK